MIYHHSKDNADLIYLPQPFQERLSTSMESSKERYCARRPSWLNNTQKAPKLTCL